jgi:fatty-acyl-CoA synthase
MISISLRVGEVLETQARVQPNVMGVRDLERTLTFREWHARSNRLANGLRGLGLAKGDRVAVFAYNRVEWAEIYVAAALAGVVPVPINFRLNAAEAAFIIRDAGAAAIIVEDVLADLLNRRGTFTALPRCI